MTKSITQSVIEELPEQQAASLKMLLERGIKIPPQPRVAQQFRSMVERGERDVRRLAHVLAEDPGITGMLFKVAQTPAYQQYHPFGSIEEILQAVGLKQTANLVTAIAFGVSFPKGNTAAYEAYWARSRSVAKLAMLVEEMRVGSSGASTDQVFLAGTLHDAGVPVMMQRFPGYCETMRLTTPGKWSGLAQEDSKFFADHAVVGYLIARHWHLPDYVCAAIRFHHDLDATTPQGARGMVALIQYAVELYHRDLRVENPDWLGQREAVYEALDFSSVEQEQQCADAVFVAFDTLG